MKDTLINSYESSVTDVDQDVTPFEYMPVYQDESRKISMLESFGSGLAKYGMSLPRALYTSYLDSSTYDKNYNVFNDPLIKSRGNEFILKYKNDLIDIDSADDTLRFLSRVDTNQVYDEAIAANPVSGLVGSAVGMIADPISLLPVVAPLSLASKIGASGVIASGIGLGAVSGAIYGKSREVLEPNYETKDIITDTVIGAAVGGIIGVYGSGVLKPLLNKSPVVKTSEKVEKAVATNKIDFDLEGTIFKDYEAAYGTDTGSWLGKLLKYVSPNQRLLNSSYDSAKYFATVLGEWKGITKGNVAGRANEVSIGAKQTIGYNKKVSKLNDLIDEVLYESKSSGVNKSRVEIIREAYADHALNKTPSTKLGTHLRTFFKEYESELLEAGVFKNATGIDNYIPHQFDWDKIVNSRQTFVEVIKNKIRKRFEGSESALTQEAYNIIDDLKQQDLSNLGKSYTKQFKPKSTLTRELNLSNEEALPFLRDDYEDTILQYVTQMETMLAFKRTSAFAKYDNPYEAIGQVVEEERKLKLDALNKKVDADKAAGLSLDVINKKYVNEFKRISDDADEAIRFGTNILDALTGQVYKRVGTNPTVANISSTLRTFNYMTKMGASALAQIADTAQVVAYKIFSNQGALSSVKQVTDEFIKLSDRDRSLVAYSLENGGRTDRVAATMDIDNLMESKGGLRKALNYTSTAFSKLSLISAVNKFNYNLLINDVSENTITAAVKMAEGKIKPGSVEASELARFGIDLKNSKKIVEQYNKHKTYNDKYKRWELNLDSWEGEVGITYPAMLNNYVNRIITNPSSGSKYFWMNTASGRVVMQFKGWVLGAAENILQDNIQMAGMSAHHNRLLMGRFLMLSLGGTLSQIASDTVNNRKIEITPGYIANAAVNRGGIIPLIDLASQVGDQYGMGIGTLTGQRQRNRFYNRNVLEPFLGPTISLGIDAPRAIGSLADGFQQEDINDIRKIILFGNHFGVTSIVKRIDEE